MVSFVEPNLLEFRFRAQYTVHMHGMFSFSFVDTQTRT